MNYEKRICCFIDILGFRNHIKDTIQETNEDNLEKIESIKNIFDLSKRMTYDSGFSKSKVVTYFSDSIVISYEFSENSQLYHTLIDLLYVSFELANKGYLVRGGVTIGKLIHTKELIFGPAMVSAYDLESKKAKYPRIIVEKSVVENGIKFRQENHSQDDELEYIKEILTQDEDGYYYIDYIAKAYTEFNDPEYDLYNYLERLKLFFIDFNHKAEDIKEKLIWLQKKINNQISQIHINIERENFDLELRNYYRTLKLLEI
ncbi:hypothetical protein [uncultured Chryseobacterium sp.]|uniref:hypothetical protein n=1 Tax=uncultured Chryseobacterium sp. TaxID=259322 RepID=UPI0025D35A13|nr:hypothetical protein [uncultured Chryseobacterium sp.]